MANITYTFIATVRNEEKNIAAFLESILKQSKKFDEVVIVDAYSFDNTFSLLQRYSEKFKKSGIAYKILKKKGNRSVGRNEAIKRAQGTIILVSDAGCILHTDWFYFISKSFNDMTVDVVSGFYYPSGTTTFQKCFACYTSVMKDAVNPASFLPSSRSIAFRKTIWRKANMYPEYLDTCEDLVFAAKLKKMGFSFVFQRRAIVYWSQAESFLDGYKQLFSYAKGDGIACYIRPTVYLLYLRYIIGIVLLSISMISQRGEVLFLILSMGILYAAWAVAKNKKYVTGFRAYLYLLFLQIISDIAVLSGTLFGVIIGTYDVSIQKARKQYDSF